MHGEGTAQGITAQHEGSRQCDRYQKGGESARGQGGEGAATSWAYSRTMWSRTEVVRLAGSRGHSQIEGHTH